MRTRTISDKALQSIVKEFDVTTHDSRLQATLEGLVEKVFGQDGLVEKAFREGVGEAIRGMAPYAVLSGLNVHIYPFEPQFDDNEPMFSFLLEELFEGEDGDWPEMAALLRRCADKFEKKAEPEGPAP